VAAARDIKAVNLELGGKSRLVVFADTPLEEAVEWIMFGIFWNQGEVCSATARVPIEAPTWRPSRSPPSTARDLGAGI